MNTLHASENSLLITVLQCHIHSYLVVQFLSFSRYHTVSGHLNGIATSWIHVAEVQYISRQFSHIGG